MRTISSVHLRMSEAARRLGISRWSLWRWAKDGLVPCLRMPSGQLRFTRRQVAEIAEKMGLAEKAS